MAGGESGLLHDKVGESGAETGETIGDGAGGGGFHTSSIRFLTKVAEAGAEAQTPFLQIVDGEEEDVDSSTRSSPCQMKNGLTILPGSTVTMTGKSGGVGRVEWKGQRPTGAGGTDESGDRGQVRRNGRGE